MPNPLTFHVQIKDDAASQSTANDLQGFFTQPKIAALLNESHIVHYARILEIPIQPSQVQKPNNVFALQIVVVFDGDLTSLLKLFWDAPLTRNLFVTISGISRRPASSLSNFDDFSAYINANNLNPSVRELHKGYNLKVTEILKGFSSKS